MSGWIQRFESARRLLGLNPALQADQSGWLAGINPDTMRAFAEPAAPVPRVNGIEISEDIRVACELSEARAWKECFEWCAQIGSNSLGAEIAWVAETPVPMLTTVDFASYNRVVGLGVGRSATEDDVQAVAQAYESNGQTTWTVACSPTARSSDLGRTLEQHGLARGRDFAKVIRDSGDAPDVPTELRIELVGPERADDVAKVSLGAWGMPRAFRSWFAGTVGRPGWHHYLGFDGVDAVATGALYVSESVGWLGFGGTLPAHRRRGGQGAIIARRIRDAAGLGCKFVHAEADAEYPGSPSQSLRNLLRTGFQLAYLRPDYAFRPTA